MAYGVIMETPCQTNKILNRCTNARLTTRYRSCFSVMEIVYQYRRRIPQPAYVFFRI